MTVECDDKRLRFIPIEEDKLENELRQQVIGLWNRIERRFKMKRESKYAT